MVTPPRGGRSDQLFHGSGTPRARGKISSVALTLIPIRLTGVTAADLALGHDQVRRARGGGVGAGRRDKLGQLPNGAALGHRRRRLGEDPGAGPVLRSCRAAEPSGHRAGLPL